NALFDPIVRTYMQTIEQRGECFACHTTGYNTNTGQFVLAGVTCEACHGPYRPQHPQESMAIATSPDFCGSCHSSTRAEWESSRHGQIGVICLDCHEVHTQHTRTSTVEQNLCAICHQAEIQDEIHQAHAAVALGCIDCHLDRSHRTIPINGETATGHSFAATGDNCDACHIDR
ncbi:MAG TPA: cytochrome c3 family protein, partial [Caldilineaceae bacterium]|nr:cytochrome c3 family protein [Caldilineaceae bacterium]